MNSQRSLPHRLLSGQTEAQGWICDGLDCNIIAFSTPFACTFGVCHCSILEEHVYIVFKGGDMY